MTPLRLLLVPVLATFLCWLRAWWLLKSQERMLQNGHGHIVAMNLYLTALLPFAVAWVGYVVYCVIWLVWRFI